MEIKLGQKVKDRVTGYEGIAYQSMERIGTNTMIGVQAAIKPDGTVPDMYFFDSFALEITDANILPGIPDESVVTPIQLGEEAEDITCGARGIVVTRITFLNGCVHFSLQQRATESGTRPEVITAPAQRLKTVGPGITGELKQTPENERTGGPILRGRQGGSF